MNTNILEKLNSLFSLEIKDVLSQISNISNITTIIFNLIIEKKKLIIIVKP